MVKFPNLTLGRVLRRHKKHPQDKELHKIIESASVGKKEFMGFIIKATKGGGNK